MALADLAASWSTDESRKTGAVLVDSRNVLLAVGWNGLPRGVKEVAERLGRPAKDLWTEHAERNAIYDAAAKGISTHGARMYLTWYPCADCARALVQAGVHDLVCVEPDWQDPKWRDDFLAVKDIMLREARVDMVFVSGRSPPRLSVVTT